MTVNEISVSSKEQTIQLSNGWVANVKFDPIYKRWFCDIYLGTTLVYAGVPLNVDSFPLRHISPLYIGVFDRMDSNADYEPYLELGGRLALLEITDE